MTQQLNLFTKTGKPKPAYAPYRGDPPAQKHSPTSIAAATQIKKCVTPLHKEILAHLLTCPNGSTDEEMQSALNMPANTQRPRRRELELSGQVRDSGITRKTKSGRQAVVWTTATEKASPP